MKLEIFILAFGVISLLGVVAAQDYICENGTCVYHGKFNVEGDQAGIVISPIFAPGCQETWSCSCVNGVTQCVDANGCGTTSTIPASQGQACDGSPGGGGPSGGGGPGGGVDVGGGGGKARISECVELWQCEEWGECVEGKQTRSCRDLAQCGTFVLKPNAERVCASGPELKIDGEEQKTSGLLGAVLGALGNLGKSKAAIVVIFIALVIAAGLIISAVRGQSPAAAPAMVENAEVVSTESGKSSKEKK